MDALSKMRKAGLTLPSVEGVNILRDPPSSIHTRKKERVNAGDIMANYRESKDRLSENIRYYPTGVNPSVSVSYANRGGGSNVTSLSSSMAHNPYKVAKDGAFRPPMFRQEDLLPLSRQKRKWTTVQTRPKPMYQRKALQEVHIDFSPIKTAIQPRTIRNIGGQYNETYVGNAILDPLLYNAISQLKGSSTRSNVYSRDADRYRDDKPSSYNVIAKLKGSSNRGITDSRDADRYRDDKSSPYNVIAKLKGSSTRSNFDSRDADRYRDDKPLSYNVIAKLNGVSMYGHVDSSDRRNVNRYRVDKPLTSYVTPGYTVQIFDKTTRSLSELQLPEKKLKDIVATASLGGHIKFNGPNGQTIKLQDYTWTVYQTPKNTNMIVLEIDNPDIELKRNMPISSANSRIKARIAGNPEVLAPILENNRPIISAHATPVIRNGITGINDRDVNINSRSLRPEGYTPRPSIVTATRQDLTPTLSKQLRGSNRRC